ncbi:MAG TPA: hypothetical protein VKG38_14300 [Solirubrobacteraceae bacterium]|nr:hypothetical protein [Solirubrobacteraceae bacterium]
MDPFDPRLAVIAGLGAAVVSSHRFRAVIGHSAGYAAAGATKVGDTVASAARDIYGEARGIATSHEGKGKRANAPVA